MLDGVRDVDLVPIDSRGAQAVIEQPSGGADEGLALDVFAIARLLAHEHHLGVWSAIAEDRLGACLVQITRLAAGGGGLQAG